MGRHGIHSPFVYRFIEVILQNREHMVLHSPTSYPDVDAHYNRLFNRISQFYGYERLIWAGIEVDQIEAICDVLLMRGAAPMQWAELANRYFPALKNNSAVFVIDIHKTAVHTREWNRICSHDRVLMSMDLYGVGLIFFNQDFKEKQQFVLRY